jgi:putative flippase GtrA
MSHPIASPRASGLRGLRAPTARLSKFALVGGSGALLNTAVLVLLYQRVHLPLLVASALAVELSIVHNFVWNDRWTFAQQRWSFQRLARFNAVSLGGLSVTAATLWTLVNYLGAPYIWANLVGIGFAMLWNFTLNSLWTWSGERSSI